MKTYFTIEELCQSETAEEFEIDNYPDINTINNLNKLIEFYYKSSIEKQYLSLI